MRHGWAWAHRARARPKAPARNPSIKVVIKAFGLCLRAVRKRRPQEKPVGGRSWIARALVNGARFIKTGRC